MGIYADHIFPRLLEVGLRGETQRRLRRETLASARGRVLEVGFGTGLNLPHYPPGVESLVAVDPARALEKRVERRIEKAAFPVERHALDAGGGLPFPDATFDTAVSTWTLCSIERLDEALAELRRVLRPEGRFLFLEHGRSERRVAAALQDLFNPVQNVVGVGCNLNREIDRRIADAGFRIVELERFVMPGVPRVVGEIYRGTAEPRGGPNGGAAEPRGTANGDPAEP